MFYILFHFSKRGTLLSIGYIFTSSIFKKLVANFAFLLLPRTIAKKKIWETSFLYFILGPQNRQNFFATFSKEIYNFL